MTPYSSTSVISGVDDAGVYLCVKAYGEVNLTYSLRAALSDCPADFTSGGEQLLCSSPLTGDASQQRYSQCAPDGTCVCKPPYDKPVDGVYPCEDPPPPGIPCSRIHSDCYQPRFSGSLLRPGRPCNHVTCMLRCRDDSVTGGG